MADKHPRIHGKALHRPGSAPLPHSGLRGAYTRVLSGYPSLFWQKEKPVLMKNEAILTCFASIPGRFLFLLLIDTQNIIVFFP